MNCVMIHFLLFILHQSTIPNESRKKYTICEACYYRTVLTPSGIYPCSYFRGLTDGTEIPTSWENMVKIRNSEINKINPSKQCKHFCARNKLMNVLIYFVE